MWSICCSFQLLCKGLAVVPPMAQLSIESGCKALFRMYLQPSMEMAIRCQNERNSVQRGIKSYPGKATAARHGDTKTAIIKNKHTQKGCM
ncbi:hypothetical protein B0T25DRAFT_551806, partial [Lasiosphaeria hispida]